MLRPVIMIGCGGSGQKAVRYVRDAVRRRLLHAGWTGGFPRAWQFIGIDTLTTQEDEFVPYLPTTDYLSVSLNFQTFSALNSALDAKFPKGSPGFKEMMGWRPNPAEVMVPLTAGAGQLRAVGRVAGVLGLQSNVQQRIVKSFSDCAAGGPELAEVSQQLGVSVPPGTPTPDPITIVVGSLAGGTGAGIMLDVIDLVRRSHLDGQFPVLVGFTPDIFGAVQTDMMAANSAAFMSEMMSAYWDNHHADDALIPATVDVGTRGPHSIFLVGRKNMDGLDLMNSNNVYRAVGEALAAVTTSVRVQEEFHNFITVNWAGAAPQNAGGYGFHNELTKGVASSFGSTTISIGRDRFREYLEKLLHRSVVEHLSSGFEQAAVAMLGESESQSLAGEAKIAELARRLKTDFVSACGLYEKESVSTQISDVFYSKDLSIAEFQKVSNSIKQKFVATQQLNGAAWQQTIFSQGQQERLASAKRAEEDTRARLVDWSSMIYQKVLNTSTDFSSRFSFPVVSKLLEFSRADLLETAAEMRKQAVMSRQSAEQSQAKARTHLANAAKGNLAITADPVQSTINDLSRSIGFEWLGKVQDQIAIAAESIATGMFGSIDAAVRQAMGRLSQLTTPIDGKPAVVSGWPQNDGTIPTSFAPSPVEFYLEGHEQWPSRARSLLELSLGTDRASLPTDPVQAARTQIIRGGFGEKDDQTIPGLIWAETVGGRTPRWSVGDQASVVAEVSMESISERIQEWLMRPSTEIANFLSEGLRQYLQSHNEKTRMPIPDHSERLATFRQKLQEALNQSRPLIEINHHMNATVHVKDLNTILNVQGFPFAVGHPAREVTTEVIQGHLQSAIDINSMFTDSESESVLISSFLVHPVHPAVISSFTQPLGAALSRVQDEGKLRAAFWLWRRARTLENFIPLPDELRYAAIRGFAVARSLGYMTAEINSQNKIVAADGIHEFPKWLLTSTTQPNILAALLESMVLTFADAPTKGKDAFNAYRAMIDLGYSNEGINNFEANEHLRSFVLNGQLLLDPVDKARSEQLMAASSGGDSGMGPSAASRCAAINAYLDANISHFQEIKGRSYENTHYRTAVGRVEPTDTLSLELIDELLSGYEQVRKATNSIVERSATIA